MKNDIFKTPKKRYYLGKLKFGTPYMYPRQFISTILDFRKIKNKPKYNRNYNFDLTFLGYNVSIGFPIWITRHPLFYKEKYHTPRYLYSPAFYIYFFKWQFCIFWNAPDGDNDRYYEQYLWWKYYCDRNIIKARSTWKWVDAHTKVSTWKDSYLEDWVLKELNIK